MKWGFFMTNKISRKTIEETAYQLFREKGYDNVTINDICKSCSITKPTFYAYIPSKDDILARFYDEVTEAIASKTASLILAENYWEQLLICFETLIEESMKIGFDLSRQMFIMNLKEDHGSFDLRPSLTKVAVAIIQKAQKAGQIRNTSTPESLYRASAFAFTGYELMWCIKGGTFDWKKEVKLALEDIYDVREDLRSR